MNTSTVPTLAPQPKTQTLADLITAHHQRPIRRLLVVGCGSGREAASLKQTIGCDVIGIDIADRFDPAAAAIANLEVGDATAMRFPDASFDFVYSFHALEHIPNYRRALQEMRRVLAPEGGYCIGTPNSARLVGYLGAIGPTPLTKLKWNMADWEARLKGRFKNEFGAHAGFTRGELGQELRNVFSQTRDITMPYYERLYASRVGAVRLLNSSGLAQRVFPSIYFVGSR